MLFNFNVKSVALLLFFCHALLFSLLLFIKSAGDDNRSDKWLSGFLFLAAMYIAPFMLGYAGWYASGMRRDILFYTPFQQLLLLPPVLYCYVRSLLRPAFKFRKSDYWHFIPAILYGLYSLIVFITDKWVLNAPFFYEDGRDKDFSTWYQLAGFLQMIVYLFACLSTYKKHRKEAYDTVSFAESVVHRWMQRFLVAFLVLLTIRLFYFFINPEWAEFGRKFWYYSCFSILTYYIAVFGYINSATSTIRFPSRAPGLFSGGPALFKNSNDRIEVVNEVNINRSEAEHFEVNKEQHAPELQKETLAELSEWKNKIEDLLKTGRLFENPLLTLSEMADKLGIQSKKVSRIINQGFGMNFNDLINFYRVGAVVRKIEEGEENLHTILGLAFYCGFNSKSTFNRAFKKHTGYTPKELIKQKKEKIGVKS